MAIPTKDNFFNSAEEACNEMRDCLAKHLTEQLADDVISYQDFMLHHVVHMIPTTSLSSFKYRLDDDIREIQCCHLKDDTVIFLGQYKKDKNGFAILGSMDKPIGIAELLHIAYDEEDECYFTAMLKLWSKHQRFILIDTPNKDIKLLGVHWLFDDGSKLFTALKYGERVFPHEYKSLIAMNTASIVKEFKEELNMIDEEKNQENQKEENKFDISKLN